MGSQAMVSKELSQIIKGKRAKRQRPSSPLTLAITCSSSSVGENGGERGQRIYNNSSSSDPSTSVKFTGRTDEEEDMANCLILLAQGNRRNCKLSTTVTYTNKDAGLYAYECKICNRRFPSFQALGGHRAGHKKSRPGNISEDKKALAMTENGNDIDMSTTLSLQIVNDRVLCSNNVKSNKVHECSICGDEFSSGQALGGHMRRHRAFAPTATATAAATTLTSSEESKKPRDIQLLDLNLPAVEDDLRESKFHFASKEQVLVFTASSLVDCHY
ncbi:zinc finger protein ZAT5-like [Populus alba x Populus x berolinensis]|uniref:Zinc finger protein ZAT5-like n=1 Tax=Populus alba x Populus x berolinensis TaxID=444605 RepID=A0AAD6LKG1_9ROSI|nr:zinc finger protein ZAT5-like [Populus alba x Populus x berolinensis]KAJ6968665.1 zinc finger protein ZAT5-like [Populus alba x Populus x berolinensis]